MADNTQLLTPRPRLRVCYRKDGRLAYLGHLEVLRTIERSVRRSGLPHAVGNGFAKRLKLQFSQALPVGAASLGEYYDLTLTEEVPAHEALQKLIVATPSALAPYKAAYVSGKPPALEAWLTRASWELKLAGAGVTPASIDAALSALAKRGSFDYMRGDKPKTANLSTTLVAWSIEKTSSASLVPGELEPVQLTLDTRSSNDGALRPQVLINAAFKTEELAHAALESLRVCRIGQWHEEADGSLTPPM